MLNDYGYTYEEITLNHEVAVRAPQTRQKDGLAQDRSKRRDRLAVNCVNRICRNEAGGSARKNRRLRG